MAQPKKVVVAEDTEVLSRLIRNSLAPLALQLVEAYDGAEALEKIKSVRPDLVIMDMDMPKMSGAEVTRAVRALPAFSKLPILVLTALGSEADARAAGCTDFMNKPYSPAELRSKVRSMLGEEVPG